MLDKDKLQVVMYINVCNIYSEDIPEYVNEISKRILSTSDNTINYFFIPISDGRETFMEFHWPPDIEEEEQKLPNNLTEYIEENNINVKQ